LSGLDAAVACDLVRRIAAGEERAEGELVERCGPVLRFLTRRFTRSDADAEDLYQETLILALEKIRHGEVREPERLGGFLRALAKNLSVQRYRRRSYDAERPAAELPDAPDEGQPDPLGGLLHRERNRLTRALLAELTVPRDREVLFRYYLAEEESGRICEELGIDGEHFYRVLSRARQRYRRLWEESAQEGAEAG
jgi:RNA polymerase sigma-70 factor, ECF subfamily